MLELVGRKADGWLVGGPRLTASQAVSALDEARCAADTAPAVTEHVARGRGTDALVG